MYFGYFLPLYLNVNVKNRDEQASNVSDINSSSSKSDDDSIYLIDSNGKQVTLTEEDEIDIEPIAEMNCNEVYKDALLASLYSQLELLRNEIVEKNY